MDILNIFLLVFTVLTLALVAFVAVGIFSHFWTVDKALAVAKTVSAPIQ